jgi:hypothetical protein
MVTSLETSNEKKTSKQAVAFKSQFYIKHKQLFCPEKTAPHRPYFALNVLPCIPEGPSHAVCFTNLGKLNLLTVVKLKPIFAIAPVALKMRLTSKEVSKIIISLQ